MSTIYLVRHAQACFGEEDYDRLSPIGGHQSRALSAWIRHCNLPVDRVVIGSETRHRQTAECCLAGLVGTPSRSEWQVVPGFSEFDHAEVVRRFRPDLASADAVRSWLSETEDPRQEYQKVFAEALARWISGGHDDYGESFAAFRARCWQALSAVHEMSPSSLTTWVFTSGGPIATIVQHALAIPNERIAELTWALVNTGITKLVYRRGGLRAVTINQYPHLELAARPDWITYR